MRATYSATLFFSFFDDKWRGNIVAIVTFNPPNYKNRDTTKCDSFFSSLLNWSFESKLNPKSITDLATFIRIKKKLPFEYAPHKQSMQ